jgi:DNA-binding SARP family transcriptional activator
MDNALAGLPGGETPRGSGGAKLLSIRLLGIFETSVRGRAIESSVWRLRKATHLIKILALTPGHRLHRDQLIDALWPEVDPDSALSSFHQALHAARRALEPERAARSSGSLLRLQQQILSLEAAGDIWIDVEAFQAAATSARAANDLDACLEALALYTGDLLPEDLYESWTQRARDALRAMYLDLLFTSARLQEERGALADAIESLRRLIDADPLNEAAYASLMQLYGRSGRRDQALRLFQQLSETLRTELDTEPSAELTELHARVSTGELTSAIAPQTAPTAPTRAPEKPATNPALSGGARISLADLAAQSGLVNRQAELDTLQQSFDALQSGVGRIVLLEGEPGIGKTRLTEELAHFAGMSGATVLWARCHDAEGSPAFWPWSQIVRNSLRTTSPNDLREDLGDAAGPIAQVVPEIRAILPESSVVPELNPDEARFRFFDSMTMFLVRLSECHPLVLIIEDLHWADRSSLMLLEFLADEIAQRRIMLVITCRASTVGDTVPLIRALERLNRSRATQRVQVTGFQIDDTERYSRLIAGRPLPENLVETIYQRTNGNPFFLREVVQLLAREGRDLEPGDPNQWGSTIPIGVREAVTMRLSELSDESRRLLVDAAVIGGEFQIDVLAAMNDRSVNDVLDLLEEAVALGVIAEDRNVPDRFHFTHILTQQTLYEGLIVARRARMHARVGDAIERLRGSSADPPFPELSHHFFLAASAGEAERAVTYLTHAGEQSMARLAYAEAVGQFRRAVEVLDRFMPERQDRLFDVLHLLIQAELAAGESRDASESSIRSVEVARTLGDPERLALAALQVVDLSFDLMDWRAGDETALLEEALQTLPDGDSPLRVQVMSSLALTLFHDKTRPHWHEAGGRRAELAREAVAMARRIGAPVLIADALFAAHDVLWTNEEVDQRLEIARELLALAVEIAIPQLELAARAQLIGEFMIKGLVAEADQELDAYEAIATRYRLPVNIWSVTMKRAMRAFMRGELNESEQLMERAREIGLRSKPDVSRLSRLVQLFFLRREQDRLNEVEETLTSEAVNYPTEPFWQCLLAVLYADRGQRAEVTRIADELLDRDAVAIPRDGHWLASLVLIADACATLENADHSTTLIELLRPHAGLFVCPGNHMIFLGPVSHYLGRLSTVLERWDEARRWFEAALDAERAAETPLWTAHTELAYASMLAKRGEPDDPPDRIIIRLLETSERYGLISVQRQARALQKARPSCHSP